jgi:hypothetical protein
MACDPPNCLEIPPATGPGSTFPVCRWDITWYRIWPISFPLSGADAGSLAAAINGIANAGGRIITEDVWFLDSDGKCTLEVSIVNPTPATPNQQQPEITCPPGYVYDLQQEACVLETIIIPPPPNGGGGSCSLAACAECVGALISSPSACAACFTLGEALVGAPCVECAGDLALLLGSCAECAGCAVLDVWRFLHSRPHADPGIASDFTVASFRPFAEPFMPLSRRRPAPNTVGPIGRLFQGASLFSKLADPTMRFSRR